MTSLNNSNGIKDSLDSLSPKELKEKYYELRDKTDPISQKEFKEIENEMIRRLDGSKNQSTPVTSKKTSKEKLDEILADKSTKNRSKEKKNELYNIILEEIKKQEITKNSSEQQVNDKQSEIDRLTEQLNEEKNTNNELLTDTPSLKEYYNFERRRLSTMLKKFDKFKKDPSHYPKNVLIYAMGVTNSKIFGTRQKLKRGRATLAWKRKEDDIVDNLKTMLDKLRPDSGEKSKRKEAIKTALYKELDLALKAHVEKLTKNNSLPPRN